MAVQSNSELSSLSSFLVMALHTKRSSRSYLHNGIMHCLAGLRASSAAEPSWSTIHETKAIWNMHWCIISNKLEAGNYLFRPLLAQGPQRASHPPNSTLNWRNSLKPSDKFIWERTVSTSNNSRCGEESAEWKKKNFIAILHLLIRWSPAHRDMWEQVD